MRGVEEIFKKQSHLLIMLQWDRPTSDKRYDIQIQKYELVIIIIIIIIIMRLRHSVHVLAFLFISLLVLRSLSTNSIITNLHIFLSLLRSFLLVAG